jgi:hypothetical protein
LPEPAIASAQEGLRQELKQLAEARDLTSAYIRLQQAKAAIAVAWQTFVLLVPLLKCGRAFHRPA